MSRPGNVGGAMPILPIPEEEFDETYLEKPTEHELREEAQWE